MLRRDSWDDDISRSRLRTWLCIPTRNIHKSLHQQTLKTCPGITVIWNSTMTHSSYWHFNVEIEMPSQYNFRSEYISVCALYSFLWQKRREIVLLTNLRVNAIHTEASVWKKNCPDEQNSTETCDFHNEETSYGTPVAACFHTRESEWQPYGERSSLEGSSTLHFTLWCALPCE
jgi:hypothetical protein